jgi:UDP-N-acetylmuramyl pentapeptide phosphotransferase/UDP-N-acetylglucosamine-1-phosphate transferase
MAFLILSFVTSLFVTLLVVRSAGRNGGSWSDNDLSGPQKFHSRPVPRVGGVGVFAALWAGAVLAQYIGHKEYKSIWLLLVCALPTFASGLTEDLTKNVSPRRRLVFTAVSAAAAVWLLDAVFIRTDIPGLDHLIVYSPFAIALTVFVVTGLANAVNIIDGFNGLASMCVLMMALSIAYVAFQVGDALVLAVALLTAGAVLGFFIWNFPAGLIFLGDGGAYLLGFVLAEMGVLLIHRNRAVSPIFPLLLCAYPIFETIFSIYRKKFLRGMSPGVPDGIHLHMLIYKRLMRWVVGSREAKAMTRRNSMTSPYLWLLCLLSVIPAVLWWNNTRVLSWFLLIFVVGYLLLYWRIVRFRSPKWMVYRRRTTR